MATGQTLLDLMEMLFPELNLQSGEGDVTRGLSALNAAQDLFETLITQHPHMLGGSVGTVVTVANQEHTTYPTGLLRLDGLDWLDPNNSSLPAFPVNRRRERGGHRYTDRWLWQFVSTAVVGKPTSYWTNGTRIYWDPIPDAVHTYRYYGFAVASDITAGGTFAYPDAALLPIATVATRIIRAGLDDPIADYNALAKETLNPYIDALSQFNRDSAPSYRYTYTHDT